MSASAAARNYAATLFDLAGRDGSHARYGELIATVGGLYESDVAFRRFLNAPSVAQAEKKDLLRGAFAGRAPELFVRFLLVVLDRRRQGVLPGIAEAYRGLLDAEAGRLRATVTLPFHADEATRAEIVGALEGRLNKTVVPEFHTDDRILGGLIVRIGDELMDGSVRRQMKQLRRELL
jgi:F-type H+-transporting ATPase subunit delta